MITRNKLHIRYIIPLLFCILQVAGIDAFGQTVSKAETNDSIPMRAAPQARARRNREEARSHADSLRRQYSPVKQDSIVAIVTDSVSQIVAEEIQSLPDSVDAQNKKQIEELESPIVLPRPKESDLPAEPRPLWIPNPTKATWMAVVFPGGGQIYNRKFWKLPIIYGGFAGCAYALTWNGKMYKDYSQAYLDIMDDDPNTNSYLDLLPNRVTNYPESQLKDLIKRRKDTFRRYRDLSIFAIIGVYLISIVDAYVDAELSNFDITPDLSMRVEPTLFNNTNSVTGGKSVGVQCSFRF